MLAAHETDVVVAGRPPTGIGGRLRGTRATTTNYLDGLGEHPPLLTLGSNGAVVAGAVAGLGVTLVARDAVARQLAAGELETIDLSGTPLSRPWHLVTAPTVAPTVDHLVAHLLAHGFVAA